MKTTTLSGLCTLGLLLTAPAMSQITFYEGEDFHGRAFTTRDPVTDLSRRGFNDRASSVIVESGQWQVCDDAGYRGRCVQLRPGSYDQARPEPLDQPGYDYRRRTDERVFDRRIPNSK